MTRKSFEVFEMLCQPQRTVEVIPRGIPIVWILIAIMSSHRQRDLKFGSDIRVGAGRGPSAEHSFP